MTYTDYIQACTYAILACKKTAYVTCTQTYLYIHERMSTQVFNFSSPEYRLLNKHFALKKFFTSLSKSYYQRDNDFCKVKPKIQFFRIKQLFNKPLLFLLFDHVYVLLVMFIKNIPSEYIHLHSCTNGHANIDSKLKHFYRHSFRSEMFQQMLQLIYLFQKLFEKSKKDSASKFLSIK